VHAPPRSSALLALLLSTACTTVESPIDTTLPDDQLHRVVVEVDQGDLSYAPGDAGMLRFQGRAWGRASDPEDAAARLDAVEFAARRDGDAAIAKGLSASWGAGTDVDVRGPAGIDVTLETGSGAARLSGVSGRQVIRADQVEVWDAEGSFDIESTGSVDARLRPGRGDHVRIAAEGDVVLALPPGLDYDVQIWGDPEHSLEVHDLGFEAAYGDDGYFAGVAGPGTTRVDVVVTGGSVQVVPDWGW
jgi:hypothetical protein